MPHRGNLRRHDRQPVRAKASIWWEDGPLVRHERKSVCRDVSRSGVCLEVPAAVPVRKLVGVRIPEFKIHTMGSLRYCQRVRLGYRVGIEVSQNGMGRSFPGK